MSVSELPDDTRPEGLEDGYRPVCGLAVAAFGLAILSLTAWLSLVMVWASVGAMIVSILALRQIAAGDPPMLGKKLAVVALLLAAFCTAGPVADWYTYRLLVRREAREFADYWFHLQLNKDLTSPTNFPSAASGGSNRSSPQTVFEAQTATFGEHTAVRAIQALGGKARIRYYDTERQERMDGKDVLRLVYAVTYDNEGTKTSFFIRMKMERKVRESTGVGIWNMTFLEGGIRPVALGGEKSV